jgi:hypothetical protein
MPVKRANRGFAHIIGIIAIIILIVVLLYLIFH